MPFPWINRVKVLAARTRKKEYEVVEDALRGYLGLGALGNRKIGVNSRPKHIGARICGPRCYRSDAGQLES